MGAAFQLMGKHLYTNKIESNFDRKHRYDGHKNIEIFDYKLPVSATAMWNPNKIAKSIRCRSILKF
jgi:hypothetical protein